MALFDLHKDHLFLKHLIFQSLQDVDTCTVSFAGSKKLLKASRFRTSNIGIFGLWDIVEYKRTFYVITVAIETEYFCYFKNKKYREN